MNKYDTYNIKIPITAERIISPITIEIMNSMSVNPLTLLTEKLMGKHHYLDN